MSESLKDDREVGIPPDTYISMVSTMSEPNFWWHTDKVKEVQELGVTGRGVRYAVHDTGGVTDHSGFSKPPEGLYTLIPGENPRDRNGHGTACAFIINRLAPDADYWHYKVLGDSGRGSMSDINGAYLESAKKGADFINCSYGDNGGAPIPSDLRAIDAAYEAGLGLLPVAAGNSGFNGSRNTIGRPASYDEYAWCVGATDQAGRISNFSSGGKNMDSAAFGQGMPFAAPNGGYTSGSGTSFACPYTVGVFCLLQQARRQLGFPDLKGVEPWRKFLIAEGLLLDAGDSGFDPSFGHGIPALNRILDWIIDNSPKWL